MADVYGIDIGDLPEGWHALDVIVIVKCVEITNDNDRGTHRLAMRSSDGISSWEGVGMAECYAAELRKQFIGGTTDIDDEDP